MRCAINASLDGCKTKISEHAIQISDDAKILDLSVLGRCTTLTMLSRVRVKRPNERALVQTGRGRYASSMFAFPMPRYNDLLPCP